MPAHKPEHQSKPHHASKPHRAAKRERIVIVDDQDNIIGTKSRGTLKPTDVHRVSALWVTNSKGQVLLAQRHHSKLHGGGKWASAVAGTVAKDETYESNIYKEAEEEIGLTGISFNQGPKLLIELHDGRFFLQWFIVVLDRDLHSFHLQKSEVAKLAWVDRDEFQKDVEAHPDNYTAAVPQWCHLFA
jgi:isopentenyldiphosphate isomerase